MRPCLCRLINLYYCFFFLASFHHSISMHANPSASAAVTLPIAPIYHLPVSLFHLLSIYPAIILSIFITEPSVYQWAYVFLGSTNSPFLPSIRFPLSMPIYCAINSNLREAVSLPFSLYPCFYPFIYHYVLLKWFRSMFLSYQLLDHLLIHKFVAPFHLLYIPLLIALMSLYSFISQRFCFFVSWLVISCLSISTLQSPHHLVSLNVCLSIYTFTAYFLGTVP